MPDIPVGAQIFDLVFHPNHSTVYAGLLTGEVKAFGYNDQGSHKQEFALRLSKRSCRGLAINEDGSRLWAVGKGKSIYAMDTSIGKIIETRSGAHEAPINRIKHLTPWLLSTGDDDGVIKLWDPRRPECIRSYTQHFDFITDFLWLADKKQLVATSGDGTLSVMDVRSKKTEPFAHSEDQEDELLSIIPIKGGSKFAVGTQLGILSIFNRTSGWGDCVDRVPGHPSSIDALCALPSSYQSSDSTILTGSSDGLLRVVEVLPTKLVGVIADHGDFPIERIRVDRGGEGRWVGSAGHDEVLRMTDLREVFEDETKNESDPEAEHADKRDAEEPTESQGDKGIPHSSDQAEQVYKAKMEDRVEDNTAKETTDSGDEWDEPKDRKRKRKKEKNPLGTKKKGRNEIQAEPEFFSGL